MTTPARYQIFHDLSTEISTLIADLEDELRIRLNSIKAPDSDSKGSLPNNTSEEPQKKSWLKWPKWKGLRGLGKWLWTGKYENLINFYNKSNPTLSEYAKNSKEIDFLISEIINDLNLNNLTENFVEIKDIFDKFKVNFINILKKYAVRITKAQEEEDKERAELARNAGAPEAASDDDIERAHKEKEARKNREELAASKEAEKEPAAVAPSKEEPITEPSKKEAEPVVAPKKPRAKKEKEKTVFDEIDSLSEEEKEELFEAILSYKSDTSIADSLASMHDEDNEMEVLFLKIIKNKLEDEILKKYMPTTGVGTEKLEPKEIKPVAQETSTKTEEEVVLEKLNKMKKDKNGLKNLIKEVLKKIFETASAENKDKLREINANFKLLIDSSNDKDLDTDLTWGQFKKEIEEFVTKEQFFDIIKSI